MNRREEPKGTHDECGVPWWMGGKSDIGGNQLGLHILLKVEDDICEIERERERARKIKGEKMVVWLVIVTTLLC